MTILIINIFLLLFVFIGSVIAIRGKTWETNTAGIWKSITVPGKIAILFLVCSLGLGVSKEILLYKTQTEEKKQHSDDMSALKGKLEEANNALAEREGQLKDMEKRLSSSINSTTAGMMRVVDYPFIGTYKGDRAILVSPRTRKQAAVQGGSIIKVYLPGEPKGIQKDTFLEVGIGIRHPVVVSEQGVYENNVPPQISGALYPLAVIDKKKRRDLKVEVWSLSNPSTE